MGHILFECILGIAFYLPSVYHQEAACQPACHSEGRLSSAKLNLNWYFGAENALEFVTHYLSTPQFNKPNDIAIHLFHSCYWS